MLMFSYLMATGITTGAFYALVALGIVIVYKSTEVVNLAHGELFMVGGMLAYTCYVMAGIPYLPSLLLAVAGAFVVGITYRARCLPLSLEARSRERARRHHRRLVHPQGHRTLHLGWQG